MKAKHVRLAALRDTRPDRTYRLSWLRGTRWINGQLEIQAIFVAESLEPADVVPCWIRASDFPFLILGSRWYRGVMVGKPLGLRRLLIPKAQSYRPRGVAMLSDGKKLNVHPSYALAEGGGNNPVLEFEGFDEGDEHPLRTYLPLTEVYRSTYFGIPIALPGILGGLISGAMANPRFEPWDPDGTAWIDRPREARITPARALPQELAKRLARFIFSEHGKAALLSIHRWTQSSFAAPDINKTGKAKPWLPIVPLPYERAVWDASVVELPVDENGRRQVLVLHIESFDAPEPFNELEIVAPPSTESGGDGDGQGGRGGMLLEPAPREPVDDVEDGWDPQLEPVAIDDIIARDERVRRRLPRVVRSEARERGPGSRGGSKVIEVDKVSTQASGATNKGAAPLVFTDDDPTAEPAESLRHSIQAIRRAVESVVSRHQKHGLTAYARFLPSDSRVFEFRVPASNSERAKTLAVSRQYVIAEVSVGRRFAYVIEPERRSEHQPLPLGVAWMTGAKGSIRHAAFSTEDIHRLAQAIETAAREGHSWIRKAAEFGSIGVRPVIHAAGSPPSPDGVKRFSDRISAQLMAVIGDPIAISQPKTSGMARVS
ncbi:hypothetical protein [Thermomonas fusca]